MPGIMRRGQNLFEMGRVYFCVFSLIFLIFSALGEVLIDIDAADGQYVYFIRHCNSEVRCFSCYCCHYYYCDAVAQHTTLVLIYSLPLSYSLQSHLHHRLCPGSCLIGMWPGVNTLCLSLLLLLLIHYG